MVEAGLIKDVSIKETDDIIQKIENNFTMLQDKEWTFRITSQRNMTKEYTLTNDIPINFALIKR